MVVWMICAFLFLLDVGVRFFRCTALIAIKDSNEAIAAASDGEDSSTPPYFTL